MKKLSQGVAGLLLFAMSSTSFSLDLKEAMELAQQNDTTFQAAYATYLAAAEASNQSTAAILPQIGFNAFYQRGTTEIDRSGTVVDSDNNSDGYSINLNQVIFEGDTRALNDIEILSSINYGEDTMGKGVPLPKELTYLR